MYRIKYEQGNGYSCGCCRRTSTETEDFSTPEEVQNWVNELKADQKLPQYEDDDDRDIESIEKEIGVLPYVVAVNKNDLPWKIMDADVAESGIADNWF